MKKNLRKALSRLLPGGGFKEQVKLAYYRTTSPADTEFSLRRSAGDLIYHTRHKNWSLSTMQALYHVAPDFKNYQHYYRVKSGDVVIDAGAHMGHLSLLFAQQAGEDGSVFAFEPDVKNREAFSRNVALNKHLPHSIQVLDELLWNECTTIPFYEGNSEASSAKFAAANGMSTQKATLSIDAFVQQRKLQRLNFIKMDIEGAEIEAMQGCVETIEKLRPNMAIASYHIVEGEPTWKWLEQYFTGLKYPFQTLHFGGHEYITFAGPALQQ